MATKSPASVDSDTNVTRDVPRQDVATQCGFDSDTDRATISSVDSDTSLTRDVPRQDVGTQMGRNVACQVGQPTQEPKITRRSSVNPSELSDVSYFDRIPREPRRLATRPEYAEAAASPELIERRAQPLFRSDRLTRPAYKHYSPPSPEVLDEAAPSPKLIARRAQPILGSDRPTRYTPRSREERTQSCSSDTSIRPPRRGRVEKAASPELIASRAQPLLHSDRPTRPAYKDYSPSEDFQPELISMHAQPLHRSEEVPRVRYPEHIEAFYNRDEKADYKSDPGIENTCRQMGHSHNDRSCVRCGPEWMHIRHMLVHHQNELRNILQPEQMTTFDEAEKTETAILQQTNAKDTRFSPRIEQPKTQTPEHAHLVCSLTESRTRDGNAVSADTTTEWGRIKYLYDRVSGLLEILIVLVFGIILYVVDVGSDIMAAVHHFQQGHPVWGSLTITFVVLPALSWAAVSWTWWYTYTFYDRPEEDSKTTEELQITRRIRMLLAVLLLDPITR